jgi:Tfp pilus assembly protein PilO
MNWSDLQPGVRALITVVGFLLAAVLLWVFVVAPLRSREADMSSQVTGAESRLEDMERQIESVPPASQAELSAWQTSRDALYGQLGPESELPLFVEALVRLSDAQGIDAFVSAADAVDVGGAGTNQLPSQVEQVIGTIPGARRVPLVVSAFGDYAAISSFVAQIGRLGWVTELSGVEMMRQFPEVNAEIGVVVYFRADGGDNANRTPVGNGAGQPMGGQGGGSHG